MKRGGIRLAAREPDYAVDASPGAWEHGDSLAGRPNEEIESGVVAAPEPERLGVPAPSRRSRRPACSDHEAGPWTPRENARVTERRVRPGRGPRRAADLMRELAHAWQRLTLGPPAGRYFLREVCRERG
jgi:hypothetical protein